MVSDPTIGIGTQDRLGDRAALPVGEGDPLPGAGDVLDDVLDLEVAALADQLAGLDVVTVEAVRDGDVQR